MLFAVTTLSAASNDSHYRIAGVWTDRYQDQRLEINNGYNGIEVRKRGLFRKTRKFYKVGYNEFSDSNGNVIKIVSSSKLVWKNRRNRSYEVFYRYKGNSYNYNSYQDNYRRNRYSSQTYGNSHYGRNYNTDYTPNSNYGSWYSYDGNRSINLERFGDGFRVRNQNRNEWIIYERDRYEANSYTSSYGDSYVFKDDYLIWNGKNGYQTTRYRRR